MLVGEKVVVFERFDVGRLKWEELTVRHAAAIEVDGDRLSVRSADAYGTAGVWEHYEPVRDIYVWTKRREV